MLKLINIVRCKNCIYWKPPHVQESDGNERPYTEADRDKFGMLAVYGDVGINVGGQCYVDTYSGYSVDKVVFREETDFCSRGHKGNNYPLQRSEEDAALY